MKATTDQLKKELPSLTVDQLLAQVRACRACRTNPHGAPLPHEPQPILRLSSTARIAICSQAPGMRAHASGVPFSDPSGDRLRSWLGIGPDTFYDESRIAIVPMGFCFPGYDKAGGDLPPRRECAPLWRNQVLATLPNVRLMVLVGSYAIRWHVPAYARRSMTDTVADWAAIAALGESHAPTMLPLPHPSWRNTSWLKKNPWFEAEVLPVLRSRVAQSLRERD